MFRILADWKIVYPSEVDTAERNGCFHNNKYAEIYPCNKQPIPHGYYFHELLHIALRALRDNYSYEREEILVQDIEHILTKEV